MASKSEKQLYELASTSRYKIQWTTVALIAMIGLFSPISDAQEKQAPLSVASSTPEERSIDSWIQQLQANTFQERQAAYDALVLLGEKAVPDLQRALEEGNDLETNARIQALVSRVNASRESARFKEFVKDIGSDNDHGFKAWSKFRVLAGSGRLSRKTMLEIYRLHPELADAIADSSESLKELTEKTIEKIVSKRRKGQPIELGEGMAVWFAFVASDKPLGEAVEWGTYFCIVNSPVGVQLKDKALPGFSPMLSELFVRTQFQQSTALSIAERNELPESAILARKLLQEPKVEPILFMQSCRLIAKFGKKGDIEVLRPWLDDETLMYEFRFANGALDIRQQDRNGELYHCHKQDMALAASVVLAGLEPNEFLPRFRLDPYGLIQESSIGFPVDTPEARKEAIDKWKSLPKGK